MKTERAIELLNRISDSQFDGPYGDERRKALEMAVRALEGDGDTISRKMAIDAVNSETVSTNPEHFKSSEKFIKFMDDVDIASFGKWQWANGYNTALVATRVQLKKLPSAQQQRILYANMSDAEFEKWLYEHGICNPNIHESIPCDVVPLLIDYAISELPSAQPERKNGKWITVEGRLGNEVECDKCHSVFWYWMGNYRFCPSCGADMRGESE